HRLGIGIERDGAAHQLVDRAQIVDAMQMIGMSMREQHRVERRDMRVEELRPPLLHHDRAAPAPVARIGRIAGAPVATDARHAPGRPAAQHRYAHETASGRRALLKSRKKFSLVAWASASTDTPLSSARSFAVWTMKAGSLRLPRNGTGAR